MPVPLFVIELLDIPQTAWFPPDIEKGSPEK